MANTATVADVRTWAEGKGMTIGARGRLGKNVVEAYNKAHSRRKYVVSQEETPAPTAPAKPASTGEVEVQNRGDIPVRVSRRRDGDREVVTITFEVPAAA